MRRLGSTQVRICIAVHHGLKQGGDTVEAVNIARKPRKITWQRPQVSGGACFWSARLEVGVKHMSIDPEEALVDNLDPLRGGKP